MEPVGAKAARGSASTIDVLDRVLGSWREILPDALAYILALNWLRCQVANKFKPLSEFVVLFGVITALWRNPNPFQSPTNAEEA